MKSFINSYRRYGRIFYFEKKCFETLVNILILRNIFVFQITESLCYVCKLRFPISTLASHEVDCLQQWQAKQEGRPTPTPSIPAEKSEQKKPDNRSMVDAEPVKEESSLESGDILPLDVECKELNQEDGSTSDEGRGNSQKLPSDNATETSANLSGKVKVH